MARRGSQPESPGVSLIASRRCLWAAFSAALLIPGFVAAGADVATALAAASPGLAAAAAEVERQHARDGRTSGLRMLDTGVDALRARDALIAAAGATIDAQYYIWNADPSGRYLAARLLAAADRGVRVRILLDDMNVVGRDAELARLAGHPNIRIRVYNPGARHGGVVRLLGFARDFSRLNRRMHNKSLTVDGAVTVVGGRNIGDEYFDLHPDKNFRDRDVLVVGPVVAGVAAGFESFWTSPWSVPVGTLLEEAPAGGPLPPGEEAIAASAPGLARMGYTPPPDLASHVALAIFPTLHWAPARLVSDPPPTPEQMADSSTPQPVAVALRELVGQVQGDVLLESAYFILGDESLAEAARLAARGVRLRALTNSLASNDLVTNHSGYARRRRAMLAAGFELHELRPDAAACARLVQASSACAGGPGFALHSKSIVFDRRQLVVGSFNVNLRSTYLNSETVLIIDSPELAVQVAASIEELMEPDSSWRVTLGADGLEWTSTVNGVEVRATREPMTSGWRRFSAGFYGLFPLEKYL